MMPSSDTPRVLVIGGARRVGAAIVEAFAAAGCAVTFTHHTAHDDAHALADRLGVRTLPLDLDDPAAVTALGAQLAAAPLDVVVHSAARYRPTPLDMPPAALAAEALAHYRINALAPLLLTAALADRLRASALPGGGAVVCLGDIHAMGRPRPRHAAYAMSKAALAELVASLARDLAPRVRVNGIAPGVVLWPDAGPEADPALHRRYVQRIPLGRIGTPAELAEAVRWLALDATYVTGQVIPLDGGRSIG